MDAFGGPVECPNDGAHRRPGREVRQLPHDRAVLADPGVAAHGAQRHHERHGHDRRVRRGLPGHLHSHPVRERFHLRGARRARLQHVLHRQVAPDTGRGVQPGRVQGPVAARPWLRAVLRLARRRDELASTRTSSTTTTRSTRRAAPRTATTSPTTWPTRRSSSSATPRSSTPTSPSSCTSPRRPATPPTSSPRSGPTSTRASSTPGTRPSGPASWQRQIELGLLPEGTELSPINPHGEPERTGPDGQPWPLLDTVRPWDSLSHDEQRLFARMAEVFAGYIAYYDDQLGRVLDYLEESGQLDNTHHRGGLRQRRQRRGRPERQLQRVAVLQRRRPTPPRPRCPHIDELGTPAVVQPLQHRLGVGLRHAVPVLEALGRRRGWRRRHVHRFLAGTDPAAADAAPAVRPRRRRRPDHLRAARHRATGRASRATRRAPSKARASPLR